MKNDRQLSSLSGVGKATLKDFEVLGINSINQLARCNPEDLYEKLCKRTGKKHDICVLDVFSCTIAQAKNPKLQKEKSNWWYWSRKRKANKGGRCFKD